MKLIRYHFFAFLSRMKYINRWGLMRNTQFENIQEHSLQVALISHALAVINNQFYGGSINPERTAVLGMLHDANEIITGDIPTPIKYFNPTISIAYKNVEDISKAKLISMLPEELKIVYSDILFETNLDKESWALVKAADKISAYIKCLEEEKAGNREFKKARKSIYKIINLIDLPEVKYFMNNFIQSFALSIDELE